MEFYEFKFVRSGETISSDARAFQDDLDALDEAVNQAIECDVQVWQGNKKLARVKKGNAPLNERDRYSN
jgi:hypothetical protein